MRKQRTSKATLRLATVFLSASVLLAACGSDDNSESASTAKPENCATGSITGAGSTFVQNIVLQWVKDYGNACAGGTVNYNGVGSSAGVQQLNAGTVDFAGTDVPLSSSEASAAQAKYGEVVVVPWSAGGIAVEYNLSGVGELKLTPATLAGIFTGTVKTWNDPKIVADNSGASLPDKPIQVIHRSDGSGTTAAFTAYMTATAPEIWTSGSSKDVRWPTGQGAKGSDGVTSAVKTTDGSIGYAEVSFAKSNSLGIAKIRNEAGEFVSPEGPSVKAALSEAQVSGGGVTLNYKPVASDAYAISTLTYVVVPKDIADPAKAALTKSFINYALSGGQQSADAIFYAPLAENIVESARASVSLIS